MGYALTIVLAVVAVSILVAFAMRLARTGVGIPLFGGWRWHPSLLGLAVALLLACLLLWRFLPELLILPIVVPILWWGRWSPKGRDEASRSAGRGRLPPARER